MVCLMRMSEIVVVVTFSVRVTAPTLLARPFKSSFVVVAIC